MSGELIGPSSGSTAIIVTERRLNVPSMLASRYPEIVQLSDFIREVSFCSVLSRNEVSISSQLPRLGNYCRRWA